MAVLGLRFCARAFSSCGKWGPLFIAVRGPLTIAASLVADRRLQTRRLSNCGSRAQLLRGMWDPPRPGLEPVSPALAGRLSTTAPPGKPQEFLNRQNLLCSVSNASLPLCKKMTRLSRSLGTVYTVFLFCHLCASLVDCSPDSHMHFLGVFRYKYVPIKESSSYILFVSLSVSLISTHL